MDTTNLSHHSVIHIPVIHLTPVSVVVQLVDLHVERPERLGKVLVTMQFSLAASLSEPTCSLNSLIIQLRISSLQSLVRVN